MSLLVVNSCSIPNCKTVYFQKNQRISRYFHNVVTFDNAQHGGTWAGLIGILNGSKSPGGAAALLPSPQCNMICSGTIPV
jgi:hypothetical protein